MIDIEALLSLKGRPTILDRIRLPAHLFGELGDHLFKRRSGTIYGLFQDRFGITVVRAEEEAHHRRCRRRTRGWSARRHTRRAAVGHIQRVAYTYKDVAVDARVRLVNSSQHAYASVLGSRA